MWNVGFRTALQENALAGKVRGATREGPGAPVGGGPTPRGAFGQLDQVKWALIMDPAFPSGGSPRWVSCSWGHGQGQVTAEPSHSPAPREFCRGERGFLRIRINKSKGGNTQTAP